MRRSEGAPSTDVTRPAVVSSMRSCHAKSGIIAVKLGECPSSNAVGSTLQRLGEGEVGGASILGDTPRSEGEVLKWLWPGLV